MKKTTYPLKTINGSRDLARRLLAVAAELVQIPWALPDPDGADAEWLKSTGVQVRQLYDRLTAAERQD